MRRYDRWPTAALMPFGPAGAVIMAVAIINFYVRSNNGLILAGSRVGIRYGQGRFLLRATESLNSRGVPVLLSSIKVSRIVDSAFCLRTANRTHLRQSLQRPADT